MLGQNAGKHLKCQHDVSLRERLFDLTGVSEGRDHFKPIRSTFSNFQEVAVMQEFSFHIITHRRDPLLFDMQTVQGCMDAASCLEGEKQCKQKHTQHMLTPWCVKCVSLCCLY